MWEILSDEWDAEIWNIPNVKSNHPEKTIHPCQFPIELVERLVALTDTNDWVFDPFMGVGSSLIAGLIHDRRAAGQRENTDIAWHRVEAALKGTLKKRPLAHISTEGK